VAIKGLLPFWLRWFTPAGLVLPAGGKDEVMSRTHILALAGVATMASTAALAADLSAMPMQQIPAVEASGWYLRGDIGMSNQQFSGLSHPTFATAPNFGFLDKGGFDSAPFYRAGVGYQWNNWFRTDLTGEYRGKAGFHALDIFLNGANFNTNDYTASKSEWVALANAYVDLGTWWRVTPFLGAGIGATQNRIDHFRDTNVIAGGGGWAGSGTRWNFAWALMAGAAYRVTSAFSVELSYRYLNLGKANSGTLVNLDPTVVSGNPLAPMTFNNIYSHDVMMGLRWNLQPDAPAFAPPLVRKG
jgi:opacity protein-like surface antigen